MTGGNLTIIGNSGSENTHNVIWISGSISEDTTFSSLSGLVYGLRNFTADALLTIDGGSIIKLVAPNTYNFNASLNILGTASKPVIFTSEKDDDIGGDSNGDGNASYPAPGDWGHITIDGGSASFNYTTIRYGGYGSGASGSLSGINGANLALDHSTVSFSSDYGIELNGTSGSLNLSYSMVDNNIHGGVLSVYKAYNYFYSVSISDSSFNNNGGNGLELNNVSNGVIRNNEISGNSGAYGLFSNLHRTIDARYNYWGSDDGPAPYGSGDAINTYQEWDDWCQCHVTLPTVFYYPPLDSNGNVVGPSLPQSNGTPSSRTTKRVADPVNVVFGNYTYQYTDLAFPTLGEDFVFQRTYNSASSDSGPLGIGWTHSYNILATQTTTNTVIIQREDGRKDLYTAIGGGNYLEPPGVYDTLRFVTDHYELTRKDQAVYTFNSDGTLTSLTDHNGNTTAFTYSGGNLVSLTEPTGRQVTFTYSGSFLNQLSDPDGRTVVFEYSNNLLITVTDVTTQTTTYAYDGSGRLESITDANGHTFVHNIYDIEGRVVEQRDALNNLTVFNYDPANQLTTVTDPRPFSTIYEYDSAYRLISETDPLGFTETYNFDANNNQTGVTDKLEHPTNYTYDDHGNILTITAPLGRTSTYTYDDHNNILSETDPLTHTTSYTYDPQDNLLNRKDELDNTTTFIYNDLGQVLSTTGPRGYTSYFDYDAFGHQTCITDVYGTDTRFVYDIVGRMLSQTDALDHLTTYTYDNANHLLSTNEPLDRTTIYSYDQVGNLIGTTDPMSGTSTFVYDEKDRLVTVIDPLSHAINYGYDAVNNQVYITDALTHTIKYEYDALNRLISVTDPMDHVTRYQYDPDGNRIRMIDANGNSTHYAYDELSRLSSVTDAADGTVELYLRSCWKPPLHDGCQHSHHQLHL